MILNDTQIADLCVNKEMIAPFVNHQVKSVFGKQVVSYGLSSFGYDIRISRVMRIFESKVNSMIDPKNFDISIGVTPKRGEYSQFILPPHSFALTESIETFNVPEDVMAICLGKSTYARCGLIVNVTPLEPGWKGVLTIELSNTTSIPMAVYPNEGIAQLIFFRGDRPEITYADKKGKYQGQTGTTYARV